MTWNITQKWSFLADFIDLNRSLQKAVVKCLSRLEKEIGEVVRNEAQKELKRPI